MEGAVERVRPKMMTVVTIMAALLPILWSTGIGSEVMSRIAAPMAGGMISSTVLTLAVIPALYVLVKQWQLKKIFAVEVPRYGLGSSNNRLENEMIRQQNDAGSR